MRVRLMALSECAHTLELQAWLVRLGRGISMYMYFKMVLKYGFIDPDKNGLNFDAGLHNC